MVVIHTDGRTEPLTDGSLESLQAAVRGYIERVVLPSGAELWINEEGKLKGFPVNPTATTIAADVLQPGDFIVGPVVYVCPADVKAREEAEEEAELEAEAAERQAGIPYRVGIDRE